VIRRLTIAHGALFGGLLAAAALLAVAAVAAHGAELSDQEVIQILTTEQPRDRAIRRALAYLRGQQGRDGSVGKQVRTAMTSLAVMAHLAAGVTPDDPEFGEWIHKSLQFVLAQQDENGYFGQVDGSRMYGHGITTLMLAEALGMTRDEDLEEHIRVSLERAVAVTVNAAKVRKAPGHEGGWRYQPGEDRSDLSLSGWQLMSLHATQQVGITVPEDVIKGAVAYAKRLTTADGKVGYDNQGEDHPALRGLALLSLMIGHLQDAPELQRVVARINGDPISWQGQWFFYRVYYDAVGMSRAAPEQWEAYGKLIERMLVEHQNQDGSWPVPPGCNEGDQGTVYAASMAVLALAVNRHVLPAYQR
jgi:hypothetical protein